MMRDYPRTVGVRAILLGIVVATPGLSGCLSQQPAIPGTRALPADSAALLASAMRAARPAFSTQDEALRSGVYQDLATMRASTAARPAPAASPATSAPAPALPSSPAPAPRANTIPGRAPEFIGPSRAGRHVVQVAAFRDLASAQRAAIEASRVFPDLSTDVEEQSGLFRVSVGSWNDAVAANEQLNRIHEIYPSAWVRTRSVP
ncbi:hypothetical protein BH23GEM6_BH23GEM6_05720 [soil metagenome]